MSLISFEQVEKTESVKQIQYITRQTSYTKPLFIEVDQDQNVISGHCQINADQEQIIHYRLPVQIGSGDPINEQDLLDLLYTILQPDGQSNQYLLNEVWDLHYNTHTSCWSSCGQCRTDLDTSEFTDHDYEMECLEKGSNYRYYDPETGDLVCSECESAKEDIVNSTDHNAGRSAYVPRGWNVDLLITDKGSLYSAIRYAFEGYYDIDIPDLMKDLGIEIEEYGY